MATQRDTCVRTRGSSSRVAPKKMNAPDSGLTIENRAPNASRKVVTSAPWVPSARSTAAVLFAEAVAVRGDQVKAVDAPQLRNFFESQPLEGWLVLQRMERNPFEQVAEREVKIFRQSFEHLEEPLFQPHAGLNAFDFARRGVRRGSFGGHGEFRVRGLAANDRRVAAAR